VVLLDLGQHVGLTEDEELFALNLDLRAAVLAVKDLVADLDVERRALACVLVDLAVADGKNLAIARTIRRSPRGLSLIAICTASGFIP
jgi:hypothetical protein